MRCPKCKSDKTAVIDSRGDDNSIRRRRECQECGFRFTTFERVELSFPLVIKKDGGREQFNSAKIRRGIIIACEKRPVNAEAIEKAVFNIEQKILEKFQKEITTRDIGAIVMEELAGLDEVAYVRFASVYREFSDVKQFIDVLNSLRSKGIN
ncbi:MAG: transcriptional repressor NrdR [Candidatus Dadabacteria bacterium]|nr:MAG: transcriptional repressor NrdR [Candidatus Dadabacteria bacterium]